MNLSFITTSSYIVPISDTEFMIAQELSSANGNVSISETSGSDFSIARISTDLSIQYAHCLLFSLKWYFGII